MCRRNDTEFSSWDASICRVRFLELNSQAQKSSGECAEDESQHDFVFGSSFIERHCKIHMDQSDNRTKHHQINHLEFVNLRHKRSIIGGSVCRMQCRLSDMFTIHSPNQMGKSVNGMSCEINQKLDAGLVTKRAITIDAANQIECSSYSKTVDNYMS